ncbi:MAG TPA: ABC transporter substrate-binding protein, partial [Dehalococcoidia bacterium]|nr:ABC transporter substrate-binding protein [Dehalococcoidia bacterium]
LEPTAGSVGGDLAESWELSPDKLTLTVKLTNKAKFHPFPPVNARAPDSRDVVYSYNRLKDIGLSRAALANEVNGSGPVTSISAPDNSTIVFKLTEPISTILNSFDPLAIVPVEADDQSKLDLRNTMLGSGPWMVGPGDYQPSVKFTYRRNPAFGQDSRNLPYVDEIFSPVIPEYATWLAQFKSGALYMPALGLRGEDVLPTKKEIPALEMIANPIATNARRVIFGQLPESPWRDARVRLAFSQSWDRDLFIDTFYNVSKFEQEGLPMKTAWSTTLNADSWTGWWLDPKSKDFGANAKYFLRDPAESKKLLAAAGHANGLEAHFRHAIAGHPYGVEYLKSIEVIAGMIPDGGFKHKFTEMNFAGEFRSVVQNGGGKFDGLSFINSFSVPNAADFFFRFYNSKGATFYGFDAEGKGNGAGDPTLDQLTLKMRQEFDEKKRIDISYEIQKYEASKMYYMAFPGGANGFTLHWPCVRGRNVWLGDAYRDDATLWLDQTKAPFKT